MQRGAMEDLKEALKILWNGARKDPINGFAMPLIGAGLLFWVWYEGWLTWDQIKYIICHGDLC